ncbi:hypothetical protein [Nonomuraea longicatena]|uniref:Uncharacterized protein n=1 Tax=Nonomuraea longicatena TaxID=83682 RepID=A0ABP3ZZL2_9ACTN
MRTDDLPPYFGLTLPEPSGGATHTCLPAALGPLLCEGDHVFGSRRDFGGRLTEFTGRRHRCREGCPSAGVPGRSLPVAAGVALHLKRTDPGRLVCVHLGAGVWGENAVHQALDLAVRWELPLLVVVAQSTPAERPPAGGVDHVRLTATGPDEIGDALGDRVRGVRGGRPLVAEFDAHPGRRVGTLREPGLLARARTETVGREVGARSCA